VFPGFDPSLDALLELDGQRLPYRYSDANQLLEDFWREVYAVLDELGIKR
jgi:hypothetical protein